MNLPWQSILWQQFGAAIDDLENGIAACPDEYWQDMLWLEAERPKFFLPEFWYVAYHALFWLDLYLTGSEEGYPACTLFEGATPGLPGGDSRPLPRHHNRIDRRIGRKGVPAALGGGVVPGAATVQHAPRRGPRRPAQPPAGATHGFRAGVGSLGRGVSRQTLTP